jgi:hypothetical protein
MDFDPAEIAYVPTIGARRVQDTPLVAANDDTLKGYGCLVDTRTTVCHERTDGRRCDAVQEMREGPSEPAVRSRLQTTASCDGQKPWW